MRVWNRRYISRSLTEWTNYDDNYNIIFEAVSLIDAHRMYLIHLPEVITDSVCISINGVMQVPAVDFDIDALENVAYFVHKLNRSDLVSIKGSPKVNYAKHKPTHMSTTYTTILEKELEKLKQPEVINNRILSLFGLCFHKFPKQGLDNTDAIYFKCSKCDTLQLTAMLAEPVTCYGVFDEKGFFWLINKFKEMGYLEDIFTQYLIKNGGKELSILDILDPIKFAHEVNNYLYTTGKYFFSVKVAGVWKYKDGKMLGTILAEKETEICIKSDVLIFFIFECSKNNIEIISIN